MFLILRNYPSSFILMLVPCPWVGGDLVTTYLGVCTIAPSYTRLPSFSCFCVRLRLVVLSLPIFPSNNWLPSRERALQYVCPPNVSQPLGKAHPWPMIHRWWPCGGTFKSILAFETTKIMTTYHARGWQPHIIVWMLGVQYKPLTLVLLKSRIYNVLAFVLCDFGPPRLRRPWMIDMVATTSLGNRKYLKKRALQDWLWQL